MADTPIPLLIAEADAGAHVYGSSMGLVKFLDALQKRGVTLDQLPDDLLEVGCFNTACGGHRSNGSRTSLRNLVVLEGLDFTKFWLGKASKGAARLGIPDFGGSDPFLAELEWLDLVGDAAPNLLEDHSRKIHLLDAVQKAFFGFLFWHERAEEAFLGGLAETMANELRAFRTEKVPRLDAHYARIHAFVRGHERLEIVSAATWDLRLDDCARKLRKVERTGLFSAIRRVLQ